MTAAWNLEGVSGGPGGREVLDQVSLTVQPGELVGVVGANGAGKTTLLRAGLGLVGLTAGRVSLGGRALGELKEAERARLVGYLPQERRVGWNLAAARIVQLGAPDLSEGAARALAADCLAKVGLAGFEGRGVLDLSGGERARVLLARLLATRAPLLVADEPTAGLDPDAQYLALELLTAQARAGAAVVTTLHDLGLATRVCDRLVVLKDGRVVADGPPRTVLDGALLGTAFGLDGGFVETADGPVLVTRRAQAR